mmetsp:Transcript_132150/g.313277  ORF Transcript_132150/g.313277 Transcript_132150/m.313277 type:complete len:325 (-) Transcript_132150:182-1156(-)
MRCSWTTSPARCPSEGRRVQAAFMRSTPWLKIAWNHSAGPTTPLLCRSFRSSGTLVVLGILNLLIKAAFMMQRMVVTEPKLEESQDFRALSKCAIPVALSIRGYGDWPKETTRHWAGGFGFKAWKVSSRMGMIRLSLEGPMKFGAVDCASSTGAKIPRHTAPWPMPSKSGARTSGSSVVSMGSAAGAHVSTLAFLASGPTSDSGAGRFLAAADLAFASGFALAFPLASALASALARAFALASALASAFAFALAFAPAFASALGAAEDAAAADVASMALPRASTAPSTTRPQVDGEAPERNQVILTPFLALVAQAEALSLFCSIA